MRPSFSLLCVLLGFGMSAKNSSTAQSSFPQPLGPPGFSIWINTPESVIEPGKESILNVTFTNITDHAIQLRLDEAAYRPEVRDEHWGLARLTAYGQKLAAGEPRFEKETTLVTFPLRQGEGAKAQINLSRFFDLSWPGRYWIFVHGYDRENNIQVQSNQIMITVVRVQCPGAVSAAPSMASPPVSLVLGTKHHVVEVGSNIEIDESITNTSRYPVGIEPFNGYGVHMKDVFGFSLEMKDPGGCPVKRRKDYKPSPGSYFLPGPFRPHENRKGFYLLNHMYDFSQPGVYTFQAKLRNQKTRQIIASNIVAITVVAGCTSFGALEYSAPVYSVSTDTRTPAGTVKSGQELSSCGIQQKKVCAPLLIHRIAAKYTDEALQAELAGSAVLDFVVDDRGSTANVRVRESLEKGLDEQAVAAVKQWRFKPAIYKGEPFPVNATAALEFGCKTAKFPLNFTAGP